MEETLVVLPRNHLETQRNIWVDITHKIAISNHRIRSIDTQNVTFDYKDYRWQEHWSKWHSHEEFIRRFSLHILPKRFVKFVIMVLSSTWSVKAKALHETSSESIGKVEKKPFTQMSLLQNREFTSNSIWSAWSACLVSWR
jgi:hypothetical protein